MRMTEVLKNLKGLTPDILYYWERQGYIQPERVEIGKKSVRDYSEDEFELIDIMFKFYKKGVKPKLCYEKAIGELQQNYAIYEEREKELAEILKDKGISGNIPGKSLSKSYTRPDRIEILEALIEIFKKM